MDRKTFRQVLANQEKRSKEEKIEFLKSVKFFEKLSPIAITKIADVLSIATYAAGERIIKQGEHGDRFFMVKSGKVSVTQSTFTSVKELVALGPGGYFGELALQSNEPRKASVTSVAATVCWTMDRSTFTSMLGKYVKIVHNTVLY